MCHLVFLSTDSPEDLSSAGNGMYRMVEVGPAEPANAISALAYPHRWYVECRYGGCSCHFRHVVMPQEPWFGGVEDWSSEDEDDIESTRAFYDLLARLVDGGFAVDVIDSWNGEEADFLSRDVSLASVPRDAFRFFEGYRFEVKV